VTSQRTTAERLHAARRARTFSSTPSAKNKRAKRPKRHPPIGRAAAESQSTTAGSRSRSSLTPGDAEQSAAVVVTVRARDLVPRRHGCRVARHCAPGMRTRRTAWVVAPACGHAWSVVVVEVVVVLVEFETLEVDAITQHACDQGGEVKKMIAVCTRPGWKMRIRLPALGRFRFYYV